jgi:hypothetical protein
LQKREPGLCLGLLGTVDRGILDMNWLFLKVTELFTKKPVICWQQFSYLPHIAEIQERNQHQKKGTCEYM